MADVRFLSVPQLVRGCCAAAGRRTIQDVRGTGYGFSPHLDWNVLSVQHTPGCLHDRPDWSLGDSVLLRRVGGTGFMTNSTLGQPGLKRVAEEFTSIVGSKNFYFSTCLALKLGGKILKHIRYLRFLLHESGCAPATEIIFEDHKVAGASWCWDLHRAAHVSVNELSDLVCPRASSLEWMTMHLPQKAAFTWSGRPVVVNVPESFDAPLLYHVAQGFDVQMSEALMPDWQRLSDSWRKNFTLWDLFGSNVQVVESVTNSLPLDFDSAISIEWDSFVFKKTLLTQFSWRFRWRRDSCRCRGRIGLHEWSRVAFFRSLWM